MQIQMIHHSSIWMLMTCSMSLGMRAFSASLVHCRPCKPKYHHSHQDHLETTVPLLLIILPQYHGITIQSLMASFIHLTIFHSPVLYFFFQVPLVMKKVSIYLATMLVLSLHLLLDMLMTLLMTGHCTGTALNLKWWSFYTARLKCQQ